MPSRALAFTLKWGVHDGRPCKSPKMLRLDRNYSAFAGSAFCGSVLNLDCLSLLRIKLLLNTALITFRSLQLLHALSSTSISGLLGESGRLDLAPCMCLVGELTSYRGQRSHTPCSSYTSRRRVLGCLDDIRQPIPCCTHRGNLTFLCAVGMMHISVRRKSY